MTDQPRIELSDGAAIPQLGLGVWQTPNDEAASVVGAALKTGYRHIDTAAAYQNEKGVGEGLLASGLARDEVFITTKVWNDHQGYDSALRAIRASAPFRVPEGFEGGPYRPSFNADRVCR